MALDDMLYLTWESKIHSLRNTKKALRDATIEFLEDYGSFINSITFSRTEFTETNKTGFMNCARIFDQISTSYQSAVALPKIFGTYHTYLRNYLHKAITLENCTKIPITMVQNVVWRPTTIQELKDLELWVEKVPVLNFTLDLHRVDSLDYVLVNEPTFEQSIITYKYVTTMLSTDSPVLKYIKKPLLPTQGKFKSVTDPLSLTTLANVITQLKGQHAAR